MKLNELTPQYLEKLKKRLESGYVVTPTGCWEWTRGRGHAGHGRLTILHRHNRMAHRVYYELIKGPIPEGLVLDHFVCDNPPCINPDHLKPVTHWENTLRGTNIVALNARKTHCKQGHEFTPENIIHVKKGRHCRTCNRIACHKRDIQRTLDNHKKGLTAKGTPLKRAVDYRFL